MGALAAFLTMMAPALAQSPSQAQSAAPPTREELEIENRLRERAVSPGRLIVEGDIERGPCPLADPAFADTKVTFTRVEFADLRAVPAATLDHAWRDLAGREVPVASLCRVRDRAATILRNMGYLAAVQIPPQRIEENGVVRMDVLVARLVEVQVRGDPGPNERLIATHVAKLREREYFNSLEAERQLLLMSDLPGYDVRLTLRPARTAPGDVVGDVLVQRRPLELTVGAQNLGSRATGREGVSAQLQLNGLTGLGDRTVLSLFNTVDIDEQTVVQLSHDFALGTDGVRLGGSLLYARGEPGLANSAFDTETVIGSLELTYPLIRTQALTLFAGGGLEWIDQAVDFGSAPFTRDKLRVAYARMMLDTIDKRSLAGRGGYTPAEPKWRFNAAVEARQGISGLGSSKDCKPISDCLAPHIPISNLLADPAGLVLRAQALFEYRPAPRITVAIAPRVQYSPDTLLGYEQMSLGNYTIGRGFDPGIALGDSGAGSSVELRYGKLLPRSPEAMAIQPYAFLDAAWAWNNDDGLTDDPRKVFSAGGGVRLRWGNHIDANLLIAAPLRRAGFQTSKGDVRALFTIRARLAPWDPS